MGLKMSQFLDLNRDEAVPKLSCVIYGLSLQVLTYGLGILDVS